MIVCIGSGGEIALRKIVFAPHAVADNLCALALLIPSIDMAPKRRRFAGLDSGRIAGLVGQHNWPAIMVVLKAPQFAASLQPTLRAGP